MKWLHWQSTSPQNYLAGSSWFDSIHFLIGFFVIFSSIGWRGISTRTEGERIVPKIARYLLLRASYIYAPASSIPSNFVPDFLFETRSQLCGFFVWRQVNAYAWLKSSKGSFLDLFWMPMLCIWYFAVYSKNYAFSMRVLRPLECWYP